MNEIPEQGEIFVLLCGRKAKRFLASGALPLTSDQGLCPWTPLGNSASDPVIGSGSHAHHSPLIP